MPLKFSGVLGQAKYVQKNVHRWVSGKSVGLIMKKKMVHGMKETKLENRKEM